MIGLRVTKKALLEDEQAAAQLVLAFAQRWPCVLDAGEQELITVQDVALAAEQQRPIFRFEKG
jgi:hypothetical protein